MANFTTLETQQILLLKINLILKKYISETTGISKRYIYHDKQVIIIIVH